MKAIIDTTKGKIELNLFFKEAPLTVASFIGLSNGSWSPTKEPFYNGLKFHRVIDNFMIQGGCPLGTGTGGPGYRFKDECNPLLKFSEPGFLAMANSGPNTNGSQFFITHVPTMWLNGKHTIFGKVISPEDQKIVNSIVVGDKINTIQIIGNGQEEGQFFTDYGNFDRWKGNLV